MLKFNTVNAIALITMLSLLITGRFIEIPLWVYSFPVLFWFLLTLSGSFLIRWNYHFIALHSNRSIQKNQIALTFDDGPHPEFTPKALELLQRYNAKATFFCIGQQVERHKELAQKIIDEGHSIGNHTYSHSKTFGFFGTDNIVAELNRTNAILKEITGKTMRLYRPAFGVTNPNIKKAIQRTGMVPIGWNVRSLDTTPRSKEMVLKRITGKLRKGDIVLLHDTSEKTITVLERLLLFLQQENLESVTVDQLLDTKAYA